MIIPTTWNRTCARHVRLINSHHIFGLFSPKLVNRDLVEVWAPLAMGLDAQQSDWRFLPSFIRMGELIHEVNHTFSSVICEFQRCNVLT